MARKFFVFAIAFLIISHIANAKVFKSVPYVGKVRGLAIKNFQVEGKKFSVGSYVTVEFDLKNTSSKPIKLGKYGAFVACRDPNNKNRDFAHQYKFYKLNSHKQIHIKGRIKINKSGWWRFWPGLYLLHFGFAPSEWGKIKLKAKRESQGSSSGSHEMKNPKKLVLKPPFNTCSGWKTSPGVAQTRYYCNPSTGYIGIFDSAWTGGAASYALMYVFFNSPKNQRVKIKAIFYYTGGAKTTGVAAFAGFQAIHHYNNKFYRRDIEAGLNYDIATQKIIDVALFAIPSVTHIKDVKEALEIISTIRDAMTLLKEMKDLYNVRKAKKYVYTFYINAKKGSNFVGIGLRGNCSGVVTGSSFVVVAAQLAQVEILF
ncbi:hypothetical protein [Hippea maritima]|uniref:Uncharacterized protein n=1 Tax=Hippea maritima (strain ATCC 700847 / DSM 10411 / MH2) TaxID=760142 RepID=F2LWD7_HIPMA|nr:hypothetical protein [Hippea maritima]AEA34071.1 hypothetical protein Hipma_1105 [Hippea maritima DSM 10411]